MSLSSHPRTYFWLALKLHFSLLGSLGSQALSALWIPYIRDIPDQSGSWALGNKWWVFFSVWFREEADYYQSLNSSHISLPSRTGSCRSLPFRKPWGQDYYRHHPSFHLFLSGDLSSSTDWTNTPTRILVLLREHGWGDSTSRIIVFSQQHLTHKGEITWSHPCPLEWQSPPSSPAGLSPSLRARFPHPEDSKISFLWRAYWLVGKINCLPETPTSPLEFLCEGP